VKRYTEDDAPVFRKAMCLVCGRRANVDEATLKGGGWLDTTHGWVCPGCPDLSSAKTLSEEE